MGEEGEIERRQERRLEQEHGGDLKGQLMPNQQIVAGHDVWAKSGVGNADDGDDIIGRKPSPQGPRRGKFARQDRDLVLIFACRGANQSSAWRSLTTSPTTTMTGGSMPWASAAQAASVDTSTF